MKRTLVDPIYVTKIFKCVLRNAKNWLHGPCITDLHLILTVSQMAVLLYIRLISFMCQNFVKNRQRNETHWSVRRQDTEDAINLRWESLELFILNNS